MLDELAMKIDSITITKFVDGIFYAIITITTHNKIIEIDSRPSDAVAISLRSNSPIKISSDLLETLSIHEIQVNNETIPPLVDKSSKTGLNFDDLNKLLADALVQENYELAAKLRDDISRLKNTNEIK
jgi:bifunctional DNase/RNase